MKPIKLSVKDELECFYNPNHIGWRIVNHNLLAFSPVFSSILQKKILHKQAAELKDLYPAYEKPSTPPPKSLSAPFEFLVSPTHLIGGPTPFSLSLLGAAYGLLLGKVGELTLKFLLPSLSRYIILERLPVVGAILGTIPGIFVGTPRAVAKPDVLSGIKSFFERFPREDEAVKEAAFDEVVTLKDLLIDETHWRDVIYSDPYLNERQKMLATAPMLATGIATGSRFVTPLDVAKTTLQAGLGALYGIGLTSIASRILGLTPEGREAAQKLGIIAGLVRGLTKGL